MTEITDLEICKKIAEIEGEDFGVHKTFDKSGKECTEWEYNPLTDDALCFGLMVKYRMLLTPRNDGSWTARIWIDNVPVGNGVNKSPNRAICLAIIEANK